MKKNTSPLSYLLLLIPFFAGGFFSLVLQENQSDFLVWWIFLLMGGICTFPLCIRIFSSFSDKGYGFSKLLMLLFSSVGIWTLSYAQILPYTKWSIISFYILLAVLSWGFPKNRKQAISFLQQSNALFTISFQETLFVIFLICICYIKGLHPNINGEEKFMDFALFNTLIRTETLPAPDPWLSGYSINYYYYGQYVFSMLGKVTGLSSGISYTLSMCTCLALSFSMTYSLGKAFIEKYLSSFSIQSKIKKGIACAAGLFSGFAVCVWGNSHAFFYDENSIGNRFLYFLKNIGVQTGNIGSFFYPNSTRFIGHNPDSAQLSFLPHADYTIHEFPFYSYLIGDLHAHVVSLLFAIFLIGVLFSLYAGSKSPSQGFLKKATQQQRLTLKGFSSTWRNETKILFPGKILLSGVVLGIMIMCNYWDFVIYFIVSCMAVSIYCIRISRKTASSTGVLSFILSLAGIIVCFSLFSEKPLLHFFLQFSIFLLSSFANTFSRDAFSRAGACLSFLFSFSYLTALPFNLHFQMISSYIGKTNVRTSFYQFMILWGVHLLFALLLIILTITSKKKIPLFSPSNSISKFLSLRPTASVFLSGLAVCAFITLLIPEFLYVMDIYGKNYQRTNTMFKFSYAAFFLFSVLMIYSFFVFTIRIFKASRKKEKVLSIVFSFFLLCLLMIPARYPVSSTTQRSGDIWDKNNYDGLDGTQYLYHYFSPYIPVAKRSGSDLAAYKNGIDWLNENVGGTPVICEAYGESYSDFSLVSSYTGLPTIAGWDSHEYLWRFHGIPHEDGTLVQDPEKESFHFDILYPRHADIRKIYTSSDKEEVYTLLDTYSVSYLICGKLERTRFPELEEDFLQELGTVVFEEEGFFIVEILY